MNEGRCLRRSTHPSRHGLRSIAEHRTKEIEVRGVGWDGEAFAIEPIKPGLLGLRG
jgi:hypothetical protein